ncbi:PAS domain S-box-containing protein [Methanolinea mesophila]|uniref:hybrid sensor histidine kinase/response regulator n=1 Tax=Methanolinea mesophila TaxID=547055 RepID=UPI001AEA9BCC|nr:GAF domain-containing protein [Methanolinea mesophila]MBP1929264.1 PAS domain S-box-containing protein [Methanolinea mesophila]
MISVLLVDDEPAILDVAQIFLERGGGIRVSLSESGTKALEMCALHPYDIIVSDYEMPGMNGIDLLKEVKSRNPDTPFIIFTGRGREHVAIEALNLGASFYLQKGGDPKSQFAELRNMIDQAVRHNKAEEEVRLNESRLAAIIDLHQMHGAAMKEICDYALEKAIELTRSSIGYLAFVEEATSMLTMYAWSRQALTECLIGEKPLLYPLESTGLWGEAVRQRRPVITNDYAAENPANKGYPEGHVHISRHMNVPIFEGNRIMMLAGVGNKETEYDESDIRQVTLLMGGLWQILKRKRAEEELRESEKRLRSYFDLPMVGMAIISPGMRWVQVNDTLCGMLGYPADEMVGRTWAEFTPEEDEEKELNSYSDVIQGSRSAAVFEKRYRRKDGSLISVRISSMPVRNENGSIDYFVAFFQDITPLERTRQELTISNERVTAVLGELNAARSALAEQCERLLREESLLHESEAKYNSLVEKIGSGNFDENIPADPIVSVEATSPSAGPGQGTAPDDPSRDPACIADRKFTLLDTITRHDTNNKLAVVSGYIELMKESSDDPAIHSYLRRQERAVEAIQHILTFTKAYRDLGMKEPSWQDVAGAVRNSAGLLELQSVTIYMDLAGLFVRADPLFEKVFYNLIENALQYGKKITKIEISAIATDEGLIIIIEDDGTGIPNDQKERIFEPGVGENTGYGLFLVREILSMTEFSIRENGHPGEGARFEIVIPHGSYRFE